MKRVRVLQSINNMIAPYLCHTYLSCPVVLRPENRLVVSSCWLYKVKQAVYGSVEKHKARFVFRGFSQVEGIDYDETFAPIARYSSIRFMLAL